jgi:hypothetical protein
VLTTTNELEGPPGGSPGGLLAFCGGSVNNKQVAADCGATAISHGAPFVVEPGAYIKGYRQLSALRVGFYPIHRDKSPAVHGKLNRVATVDPIKIRFWADHCHHRGFAARLLTGCRIVVIDTEDPFKHPDRPGPDGS